MRPLNRTILSQQSPPVQDTSVPVLQRMPQITDEEKLAAAEAELKQLEERELRFELEQAERELSYLDKEDEAWYEDFAEGLGVSGLKLLYGLQDLLPRGLSQEDKARLEDWKRDAGESGFGTAGEVIGDIAQFVAPGAGILKGAKGVNMLRAASPLVRSSAVLGAETGLAAGLAATRLPEDDETRAGNALTDAAFTVAGAGVGKVLEKGVRGLAKTKEAQKLLDEGVYLTPGRQAQSQFIQNIETAAEVTPVLARGTKRFRQEALDSWNKNVLQKAAPRGAAITDIGTEGGKQLKQAFEKGYSDAWRGVKPIHAGIRERLANRIAAAKTRLGKKDSRVIDNVIKDLDEISSAKGLDDVLRREINAAGPRRRELRLALEKLRRDLRKIAPASNQKALRQMDDQYPAYLAAEDAIIRAKKTGGVFTPDQLMMSAGKIGKKQAATGSAPLQDVAEAGLATVGKNVGGAPLDFFRRLAGAAPSPPFMREVGETLMGNTRPQRALSAALDSPRAEALRYIMRPSVAGYGYGRYQDEIE